MSKLNISVFPFAFYISACQHDYIHPEFISILVENKPFFSLMNSISVCLLTKNVTLNLMDLTRRHIFELFFYRRLWLSLPKLFWQRWRESLHHRYVSLDTKVNLTKWLLHLWDKKKGTNKKGWTLGEGQHPSSELYTTREKSSTATEIPMLFCGCHFCVPVVLNWKGEAWALLIPKNSKRISNISSLLRMIECNWWAWCLASSNFLRTPPNVQTLFWDYWMPENNELAFSFGE